MKICFLTSLCVGNKGQASKTRGQYRIVGMKM